MGSLTESKIKLLTVSPGSKQLLINDGGGLYLRIRSTGRKTFLFRYKGSNSKDKWLTLGQHGPAPGLSLTEARKLALDKSLEKSSGKDLNAEREKQRTTARLLAHGHYIPKVEDQTIDWLFEEFKASRLKNKYKDETIEEIERQFRKDVSPIIGKRRVDSIERQEVSAILRIIQARGALNLPGRILRLLQNMYRFGIEERNLSNDPLSYLKSGNFSSCKIGERYLEEFEIQLFFSKLASSSLGIRAKYFLKIMLATGKRRGEVLKATWEDVDLDQKLWTLPAKNTKSGRATTVFLSDYAVRLFGELYELSEPGVSWIFPNRENDNHINLNAYAKQLKDRQRSCETTLKNRSQGGKEMLLPGGEFRPHDLRRTFATIATEIGGNPYLTEQLLDHQLESQLQKVYQKVKWSEQKRELWQEVGKHLAKLEYAEIWKTVRDND